jgi:hypothetical protein
VQSSLINRKFYDRAGNRAYRALIRYLFVSLVSARPGVPG